MKIRLIDSVMGSGKTTAICHEMRERKDRRYIYATPSLSEVQRTIDSVPGFYDPQPYGGSKLDALHRLMEDGRNIATTHALLLMFDKDVLRLAREKGYSLIIDEAPPVLCEYNDLVKQFDGKTVNAETVKWLLTEGALTIDPVTLEAAWHTSSVDGFAYSEVVKYAEEGRLRCINNTLYWELPPEVFDAFTDVTILTFMFDGSILNSYFDMHGIGYEKLEAACDGSSNYEFVPYIERDARLEAFVPLIKVYEGAYNQIGDKKYALSVTDLIKPGRCKDVLTAMRRYRRFFGIKNSDLMWSTSMSGNVYMAIQNRGFKYTHKLCAAECALPEEELKKLRTFVPCTAKATNDFSDRSELIYMLNRFVPTGIAQYFKHRGYPIDEDMFAISELVQWVWRSAIRRGKPIRLYLPSSRMRKLLYRELGIDPTWVETHPKELQKSA